MGKPAVSFVDGLSHARGARAPGPAPIVLHARKAAATGRVISRFTGWSFRRLLASTAIAEKHKKGHDHTAFFSNCN